MDIDIGPPLADLPRVRVPEARFLDLNWMSLLPILEDSGARSGTGHSYVIDLGNDLENIIPRGAQRSSAMRSGPSPRVWGWDGVGCARARRVFARRLG